MERIAIVGSSLTSAEVRDVEALGRRSGVLCELADALAASELVHLRTCNRVEVVYAREAGQPPSGADLAAVARVLGVDEHTAGSLRFLSGRAAVRHLFRVASSLDSLVLGEDQILSQVREAWNEATRAGRTGPLLGPAFEHAFQVAKQVRARTDLSRHSLSVMSLGVQALAERLNGTHRPRIALLGAGRTARHAARALREVGLDPCLVANRTLYRAEELARSFGERGAQATALADFLADPAPVDAVVAAIGGPEPWLDGRALRRMAERAPAGRGLVGLDLAVPRDLARPDEADAESVHVIDLESLRDVAAENGALRAAAAAAAEDLVERRLSAWEQRAAEKRAAARIEAYVSEGDELLERELARLRRGLEHIDERERAFVERWARSIVGRLTHLSTAACKDVARATNEACEGGEEEETIG